MSNTPLSAETRESLGGAFRAGYESERGHRAYREGLGFDPEMDLALALGWPFLARLGEAYDAEDPVGAVTERLAQVRPPMTPWPRDLAPRAARFLAYGYETFPDEPTEDALAAAERDDPMGEGEVPELLATFVEAPVHAWQHGSELLWLLEAQTSSTVVADALLDLLERGGDPWIAVSPVAATFVSRLGWLLARMSPADAVGRRERCLAVLEAAIAEEPKLLTDPALRLAPLRALDVIAGGQEGIERSAFRVEDRIDPNQAVLGDPARFAAHVKALGRPRPGELPTAQWVVAGGDAILAIERTRWAGYGVERDRADAHRFVLGQYGVFRRKDAVLLIAEMALESAASAEASRWLGEHAAHAAPLLEAESSGGGPDAALARRALDLLARHHPS